MARDYERDEREEYWRRQEQNRDPQNRWSAGNREENYRDQEMRGMEGRQRWGNERYDEERWEDRQQRNFGRERNREGNYETQGGGRWQREPDWQNRQGGQGWQAGQNWQGQGQGQDWQSGRGWEGERGWRDEGERGMRGEWENRMGGAYRGGFNERGMTGDRGMAGRGMTGGSSTQTHWGGGWNESMGGWRDRDRQRGGEFAGRGPRGYKRSDQRLEEDINEQLTRHPMLDASDIEVQVQNCEVTLRGHVDDREAKRIAEDIAESVFGVKDVNNQIKVKQRGESQQQEARQETDTAGKRERKAS